MDPIIGGLRFGTSDAIDRIVISVANGQIQTSTMILTDGHRLDTLAGILLDDAKLWWVIAALSGIGWGLQVPAGTRIVYPTATSDVAYLVLKLPKKNSKSDNSHSKGLLATWGCHLRLHRPGHLHGNSKYYQRKKIRL